MTYQLDSSSKPVAGTQLDCTGIVTGNTIGSFTVIDGTDTGNSVNDAVEMIPTAAWGQDLADALTAQHSRTGTHTVITATSLTTTGNSTIGGNETIAGTLGVTGATTLTGAVGGTGYDAKTIANSYKFSVYRAAAANSGNATFAQLVFDTKVLDTSSNYSVSTGNFTAPVTGFYQFNWSVQTNQSSGSHFWQANLYKNGSSICNGSASWSGTSTNISTGSDMPTLAANDTIAVYVYADTTLGVSVGAASAKFSGFLVSAT